MCRRLALRGYAQAMKILHVLDHSIPVLDGYSLRTLSILRHQRELGWETVHVTGPKHEIPGPPIERVDGWEFFRYSASASPSLPCSRAT